MVIQTQLVENDLLIKEIVVTVGIQSLGLIKQKKLKNQRNFFENLGENSAKAG